MDDDFGVLIIVFALQFPDEFFIQIFQFQMADRLFIDLGFFTKVSKRIIAKSEF